MVVASNEEIDFSRWPEAEQLLAFEELKVLLNKQDFNPDSMSDEELSSALHLLIDEIKTRDNVVAGTAIKFNQDIIIMVN
jgi:hypothetical protein